MRRSSLSILCIGLTCGGGCASGELTGPPVDMVQVVPGDAGRTDRSRGEAELYLTPSNPSHTFWNDGETQRDPWGTITLKKVEQDGTAVVDLSGTELRARPGRVFPGTGIKVVASNPALRTALLRTRWTHTVIGVRLPGVEQATCSTASQGAGENHAGPKFLSRPLEPPPALLPSLSPSAARPDGESKTEG